MTAERANRLTELRERNHQRRAAGENRFEQFQQAQRVIAGLDLSHLALTSPLSYSEIPAGHEPSGHLTATANTPGNVTALG